MITNHDNELLEWFITNGGFKSSIPKPYILRAFNEMIELCYNSGISKHELTQRIDEESIKATKQGTNIVTNAYDKVDEFKVRDEIADVIMVLVVTSLIFKLDVDEAIRQKNYTNSFYSWKPDKDGVLWRVKKE